MRTEARTAVLLAGGASRRMGTPKGLIEKNGKSWLEEQLCALRRVGMSRVVVVLGFHLERYFSRLPWLKDAHSVSLERDGVCVSLVVNEEPERGSFSSLQTGLRALPADEAAYVLPVDVPCPGGPVFESLQEAWRREPSARVCLCDYRGRGGHPVLLTPAFVQELLPVDPAAPDARLDRLIAALDPRERVRVPVEDERVVLNLNTPEDWSRLDA